MLEERGAELEVARCRLAAARVDSRKVASLRRYLEGVEEQLVRRTQQQEQLIAAAVELQAGQAGGRRRPRGRPRGTGKRQHAE